MNRRAVRPWVVSVALTVGLALSAAVDALAQLASTKYGTGALERLHEPFVVVEPAGDQPPWSSPVTLPIQTGTGLLAVSVSTSRTPCNDEGVDGVFDALGLQLEVTRGTDTTTWRVTSPHEPPGGCGYDWGLLDRGADLHIDLVVPTELLIRVRYPLAHGRETLEEQLLIDARTTPPSVVARVTTSTNSAYCAPNPPVTVSCDWRADRTDFFCTEFLGTESPRARYSWLSDPTPIDRLNATGPVSAAAWLDAMGPRAALDTWADTPDLGPVRLIAELPSRHRRQVFLLGRAGPTQPELLVAVRDADGTGHWPITTWSLADFVDMAFRDGQPDPVPAPWPEDDPALAGFRASGAPPAFSVRTLSAPRRGVRLLQVAATIGIERPRVWLMHLGIDDEVDAVTAHALVAARSTDYSPQELLTTTEGQDACDRGPVGGFARLVRIRTAPLDLTYDIEPPFYLTGPGNRAEREAGTCTTALRTTWIAGAFLLDGDESACSTTRFRAVAIGRDGRLTVHSRTRPARPRQPQ